MADKTIPELTNEASPALASLFEISEQTDPVNPTSRSISLKQLINGLLDLTFGVGDYNDAATATTPLVGSTGVPLTLTNDGLGPATFNDFPEGVTELWNTSTNVFDFSELNLIDVVRIRVDVSITTSSANQEVELYMDVGQGDPGNYQIELDKVIVKSAGVFRFTTYQMLYIGDLVTKDNPAQLKVLSDGNFTAVVAGWALDVNRKTVV